MVIVVQARKNSNRLPNKVMLPLFNNMSVLEVLIRRLWKYKENIIIATTDDGSESEIVGLCKKLDIKYFRGDEYNVFKRYYDCINHLDTFI
jgi:spore coat polysaccharide biosynthesis protein SpsF